MGQDLHTPAHRKTVRRSPKLRHALHSRRAAQAHRHHPARLGPGPRHHPNRQPHHSPLPDKVAAQTKSLQTENSMSPDISTKGSQTASLENTANTVLTAS